MPGATELVERLLADLINDSKESAFERATLPRGIEEKLAYVDWEKRDVLIGTFRNREQFDICYEKNFYYVPAKQVSESKLPIHYVALYQTNKIFGENNGQIEYYGEAIRVALVKRSSIKEVPMRRNNGDELYYRITVREWKKISETNETGLPIKPKESGFVVDFTNMFLMQHSEFVQELRFMNEAEYRFYSELKRSVQAAEIGDDMSVSFSAENSRFVFSDGNIMAIKDGKIVEMKSIVDFSKRPAQVFRMLQNSIGMGK